MKDVVTFVFVITMILLIISALILVVQCLVIDFRNWRGNRKQRKKQPEDPVPLTPTPLPDQAIVNLNQEIFDQAFRLCMENKSDLKYITGDGIYPRYRLEGRGIDISPLFGRGGNRISVENTTIDYLSNDQQKQLSDFIGDLESQRMEKERQGYKNHFTSILNSLKVDECK